MMRWLLCLSVAAVAFAQPSLIFKNGRVWTGVPQQPWAAAVAINGQRISAVGGMEIVRLAGPKTRVIDLGGKFAMPGFNDAHVHFLGGEQIVPVAKLGLLQFGFIDLEMKRRARHRLAGQRQHQLDETDRKSVV